MFYKKLETKLLNILKRMMPWNTVVFMVEKLEQMILLCGMELLRQGLNAQARGMIFGGASKLEHLLNMTRAVLDKDVLIDCAEFADTIKDGMTIWNDDKKDVPDHLRTHMMLYELNIIAGYGRNVLSKRNWNGRDLMGMRVNRKRVRVLKLNDDPDTLFEPPYFNDEDGTYNNDALYKLKMDDLKQPLVPKRNQPNKKTTIR